MANNQRSAARKITPVTLSDALLQEDGVAGAMAQLQNLIPDPTTKGLWVCRPASAKLTDFAGFTTPGFVSCLLVVGTNAYGMIASGRTAGCDEPFCFNLITNTFVAITGTIDATTCPTSPAATGAWVPPSLAVVGTKLIVCHPGWPGGAGAYFGWFDVANPAAPVWHAGNTTTNTLPRAPTWVVNFNGRAYFGVPNPTGQPAVYFTDILSLAITNSTQILTFDDNVPLTAAIGLPLNNQSGGVIQSLIVFKGVTNLYQITGDVASTVTPLAKNSLNVATGTFAPQSVCPTPKGVVFVAPDGLRLIDFNARVSDPIGIGGAGVNAPFEYAVSPSRIAAACNSNVLRISVQNGAAADAPTQEFWYDIARGIWSGPHTFPASVVAPYMNTFVLAPSGVLASLWQSDDIQGASSTFVENGAQMSWAYQTTLGGDGMMSLSLLETTLEMAIAGSYSVACSVLNDRGVALGSAIYNVTSSPSLWGSLIWGTGPWLGQVQGLRARRIDWSNVVVYNKMQFTARGVSTPGFRVGALSLVEEKLGYLQEYP